MIKISGIYLIINQINGKIYVGSAANIVQRWSWHKQWLLKGKHHNKYLQHAVEKYGLDAFHFCIVEECSIENLFKIEQLWIDRTNCCDRSVGYNLYPIAGSPRGAKHTEETKIKISINGKGRIVSEETKKLISDYQKNRSPEHRANHSAAMKKRVFSEEHKRKLKEANAKRGNSYYTEEMKLKRKNTLKEKARQNLEKGL